MRISEVRQLQQSVELVDAVKSLQDVARDLASISKQVLDELNVQDDSPFEQLANTTLFREGRTYEWPGILRPQLKRNKAGFPEWESVPLRLEFDGGKFHGVTATGNPWPNQVVEHSLLWGILHVTSHHEVNE